MADSPHSIEHERGPNQVTVDLTDADRFSVVVARIRVRRQDGARSAPSAARVAEAVDYLGERLRLIETEPDVALVRSTAPVPADGGRQYYEMRFQGDGMTLERRHADGAGVSAIPFVVPKAMLERLVDDLGRLVGSEAPSAPPVPSPPQGDVGLFSDHRGCC